MKWNGKRVLVTGGASFIGSHLVEALLKRGADVRVVDNLSSGKRANLQAVMGDIEFIKGDLKHWNCAIKASRKREIVFHLAADHGGRGYIEANPANCAFNMGLDQIVFESAIKNGVEKLTFASSACVYPTDIQKKQIRLKENFANFEVKGAAFADNEYGWAKLMGEMSLHAIHKQYGIQTAAVRIFTAYGPRENETHAIMALIAKAFIKQSPFEIWGNGKQTRNFTYVDDVVSGLMLACEHLHDGMAVNAGTPDFIDLTTVSRMVFDIIGWHPERIQYCVGKPVGVMHRAADIALAQRLTTWQPEFSLEEGLLRTIGWYIKTKSVAGVKRNLDRLLLTR